ncbi:MAG: hypothetical protein JW969_00735 [Spirochaetales bacterium]|nr:hypothetical protein [Spirochaetales bacterium]
MEKVMETENFFLKKAAAFLLDKPVWIWWLFYVAVTGALFGIFSLAFYLLGIQWWVGISILVATGIIWGSVKYYQGKGKIRTAKREAKQEA